MAWYSPPKLASSCSGKFADNSFPLARLPPRIPAAQRPSPPFLTPPRGKAHNCHFEDPVLRLIPIRSVSSPGFPFFVLAMTTLVPCPTHSDLSRYTGRLRLTYPASSPPLCFGYFSPSNFYCAPAAPVTLFACLAMIFPFPSAEPIAFSFFKRHLFFHTKTVRSARSLPVLLHARRLCAFSK